MHTLRVLDPILQAFNVMLPLDRRSKLFFHAWSPLEEFCIHYAVNDEDRACLMKLKVQPGYQHVEKLDREDWQGHAGFAKL